jgi:ATP-dependent helicase/nuclease subunit A
LMTIHKSKGLGFEVVIVPGLDRKPAGDRQSLIVHLERSAPGGNDEMLVAPIGSKGSDKHPTYAWVQRQREMRADEERKRLLYVACTRARRELHLLGTATINASGLQPGDSKSLLNAAWPALSQEFVAAVDTEQTLAENVREFPQIEEMGLELAAGASHTPPLTLRRLREIPQVSSEFGNVTTTGSYLSAASQEAFIRPEGSRRARVIGTVVHALLDDLSRGADPSSLKQRAGMLLRAAAFSAGALEEGAQEIVDALEKCLRDPDGAWILLQRAAAQSETSWTGWFEEGLQTLRADRVFTAGKEPGSEGSDCVWIIDYKMSAPAGEAIEDFMARQREIYTSQLARYARALTAVRGENLPICLGLYYPRIGRLDWWAAE